MSASTESRLLAIAMPAFNAAATIRRAVESLLTQEFPSWELSAVDDGSTDDTSTLLAEFAKSDGRIHFVQQSNSGTGAAMNKAFAEANALWVAQMGADDELAPDYFSSMAAFMDDHPGYDIYGCNAWVIDAEGKRSLYAEQDGREFVEQTIEDLYEGQQYFFAGGALISREKWAQVGGFRAKYYCEDVDLGRRLLLAGSRFVFNPAPLYIYYKDDAGQKSADLARIAESVIQIDRDLIDEGLLTTEQQRLAEDFIEHTENYALMESQRQKYERMLVRMFGLRNLEGAKRVLRPLAALSRPARSFLGKQRNWR